jgi:hypothetical protein
MVRAHGVRVASLGESQIPPLSEASMKTKLIFRILMALTPALIVCAVLALRASPIAQQSRGRPFTEGEGCSNATILGDYGTQIEGTILGPNLPLRTLALVHFDGKGNLTGVDHVVLNGVPPQEEWRPSSGTYNVNPNCTGSAAFNVAPGNPPINLHFIVVNDGRQILEVVDGSAITGVAYKVD